MEQNAARHVIFYMETPAEVLCAFCGALMSLARDLPATAQSHALHFFSCDTCGSSELRAVPDKSEGEDGNR